jgi:GTP-binding protein
VYTKADKLTRNNQFKNAAALDAGLTITADERIIFSAKTGLGCDTLQNRIAAYAIPYPLEIE